jgi:hypothetical protein
VRPARNLQKIIPQSCKERQIQPRLPANFNPRKWPNNYFDAGPRTTAGAGFINFAAATAAFGCTLLKSVVDCPSTHVTVQ